VKILLVHNQYRQPGGEDVAFEQERQLLQRAGHEVVIYHRSNAEIDDNFTAAKLVLVKKIVWATDTHRDFTSLLHREKPQLVHIHNTFVMVSPAVYLACEYANIPVIQTLHNYRLICPAASLFRDGKICEECIDHSLLRGVWHGCYRDSRLATSAVALMLAIHRRRHTWDEKVRAYVALTEFARSKFIQGGLPTEKIFVKPNFVDPDPGVRSAPGRYAVFAGRLSEEKRVCTLLSAWARLRSPIPLVIVGDGPERVKLEQQAQHLGLTHVTFLGRLMRPETLAMVRNSWLLLLPSECYENFPLTIAEAFACGVPVICSRLGAMAEVVDDGRTGLHATAGDPDDLAEKLEWAWAHPAQMEAMGKEARREYEAKYTAARNYEILKDLYEHVAGSANGAGAKAGPPTEPKPAGVPVPASVSTPASVPTPASALLAHSRLRRGQDLAGKAWMYLLTALQEPLQVFRLPGLFVRRVHIGEFLKLNKMWLKNSGVKTVIDVGAHSGEFSTAIQAVIPDIQLYAFEPLPDCCTELRNKLASRNGHLKVFQAAVGDEHKSVQFWRSSFSKASSVLRMSDLHQSAFPWSADNRPITVEQVTLDECVDKMKLESKVLLKIDVQGYEDRVLNGAVQLLSQVHYVLVEVSIGTLYEGQAQFQTVYGNLIRQGFCYVGNLEQLVSPVDGLILQVDALFARA